MPNHTPTVTASLDRSSYAVGDNITLTVSYGDADTKSLTVTVVVTDASGISSQATTVPVVIDPLSLSVSDNLGHTWVKVSDTGTVAVFTTVA